MTLSDAAIFTKKALIVSGIMLVLCLMTWASISYYYKFIYKPPIIVVKPNLNFGVLPKIKLPTSSFDPSSYTYNLNTETGSLPTNFPKIIKVYSIAQLATDLLALDRAKDLARSLRFGLTPQMLSATQYKFVDDTGGELIISLDSGNFKFRRPIATDSADLGSRERFLDPNSLSLDFKNYLSSRDLLKDGLKQGRTNTTYNTAAGDRSSAAVSLWQEDIDKIPIITSTFKEGLIQGVITNYQDEVKKYVSLDYTFWRVDIENSATYPLKKVDDAFNELKSGKANIIISPAGNTISITKVYLGYLLTEEYNSYLEPYYVFEGENFAAYVPALSSEYIEAN